jgi:hypothetical protein
MIRTIEVLFVIIIITGAFIGASYFAVLPAPRQVSPINLNRLSLTTLQMLDSNHDLSKAAFDTNDSTTWNNLQVALAASLPPNILYNLTVYDINTDNGQLFTPVANISNAQSLGTTSDVSTYTVASSNVTFNVTPEKIGENGNGGTLYILNCSDANGWWITGFTAQSLAQDFYNLLSPYFVNTVIVQNTTQLAQILNGTSIQGEPIQNAVIINTCGEAVPIPSGYYSSNGVGYDTSSNSYARYAYILGQRALQYNLTWVSIVGYPLYYVSNTALFQNSQNSWGVYGMNCVGAASLNAFLEGIANQTYAYNGTWITSDLSNSGPDYLSSAAINFCNYYGIYPSTYQTFTRALPNSILQSYHLNIAINVFNPVGTYDPGSVYTHNSTSSTVAGTFLALGLTRTPDVRVTALSLLSYYQPRLYPSDYTSKGTSRAVVLELGLAGGA